MKKVFLVVLLAVGISAFAQEAKKSAQREQLEKMTPEQRNALHLKKLTLDLDLNENQQKEIGKIIAEQSAKRQAAFDERKANKEKGIKLSADERFARENKKLDEEIANKERMKKILTPNQFTKWESMKSDRKEKTRDRMERKRDNMPKAKE